MKKIMEKQKNVGFKKYNPNEIELKWQSVWEEEGIYQPDMANAKKPFYNLMMFPYPSAEGLHVGSVYAFGGADVYARFKRMQGNDVFEPIGLDGFGIHSENHAIKTNSHPMEHAKRTEENFYKQLHSFGNSFAWNNKLETYDPHYYKWTQFLFTELFKAGLAYRKKSAVNFCPWCKTVLADEQVIDGKCERCGNVVEKRELEQWFFKITEYAERLLKNIEGLDWTEKVKIAQRNWIGKSSGVEITWQLCDKDGRSIDRQIVTFTTRKDTIPGVTFLVLAPESEYVSSVTITEQASEVKKYVEQIAGLSTAERQAQKEKTGVFTGSYAKNPFNGTIVPIYVADYVLGGYGTGAVMGMPGHDARDREFAAKFDLPTIFTTKVPDNVAETEVFAGSGEQINTGEGFDGLPNKEAGEKIFQLLKEKGMAKSSTQYHLRDWLISRQRYWGPPIPMIFCEACAKKGNSWFTSSIATQTSPRPSPKRRGSSFDDWNSAGWYPVPEKDLPVKLPYLEDYKPLGTGKAPLASSPEFYEVKCPVCGTMARRETDVSDTFLDSAWYFFRYLSVDRDDVVFDTETAKKWLPVNMYIGGAEHSVLHLLYARFMTMVLHDLGYITFEEPFTKFFAHGLIIKDGAKMSKSKGNVINPDEYIQKFGSDTLRCYLMFLGPFDQGGDFRDTGIEGMNRFLKRVWRLLSELQNYKVADTQDLDKERLKFMHETIKGVTEDLESFRYNTAIAKLMTWYNFLAKQPQVSREEARVYLQLLAPFAPFMTEELWHDLELGIMNHESRIKEDNNWSIHASVWPHYEAKFLTTDEVTIAIQVNGKLRATLVMSKEQSQDKAYVEAEARKEEKVNTFIAAGKLKHIVYVLGKVLNFVVE